MLKSRVVLATEATQRVLHVGQITKISFQTIFYMVLSIDKAQLINLLSQKVYASALE